jgi:hypothetical protein
LTHQSLARAIREMRDVGLDTPAIVGLLRFATGEMEGYIEIARQDNRSLGLVALAAMIVMVRL